jgi:hypothetical protein
MELLLKRYYLPGGTNGVLSTGEGHIICYTIELPWRQNLRNRSCIPEGHYRIILRRSAKFNRHLMLSQVPNRSLILVHPANNAAKQLKGCIAPVSILTGEGMGEASKAACEKLLQLVSPVLLTGEAVWITVSSDAPLTIS